MKTHDTQISSLINLKDGGLLGVPELSQSITRALVQMHETVSKLLKDNNIISIQNEKSTIKMEVIIREVLKLQHTFVSLNSSS